MESYVSEIILPRRRFLFLAPAIIAAPSLMKAHSIDHLIYRNFGYVCASWDGKDGNNYLGWKRGEISASAWISKGEYDYNVRRLKKEKQTKFQIVEA